MRILITGGSGCIGSKIARRLLEQGCEIINIDINGPNYECTHIELDIRDIKSNILVLEQLTDIDVLINCVGRYYYHSRDLHAPSSQMDELIDVNFKGVYYITNELLRLNKIKSSIINISSGLGINPDPHATAYCISKAAINMYTKCLALQLAPQNIRVNAVLPGPIDSHMLYSSFANENEISEYVSMQPLKKIGQPEDVAHMVEFLISEKASFITGGLFPVDGGEHINSKMNYE
jgi:NAD(P)-dependent dehydrogenase (short-subunit alcohol dehydrogenase family)